jgi:hypothetical protein
LGWPGHIGLYNNVLAAIAMLVIVRNLPMPRPASKTANFIQILLGIYAMWATMGWWLVLLRSVKVFVDLYVFVLGDDLNVAVSIETPISVIADFINQTEWDEEYICLRVKIHK